jgi:hypothetical protein
MGDPSGLGFEMVDLQISLYFKGNTFFLGEIRGSEPSSTFILTI